MRTLGFLFLVGICSGLATAAPQRRPRSDDDEQTVDDDEYKKCMVIALDTATHEAFEGEACTGYPWSDDTEHPTPYDEVESAATKLALQECGSKDTCVVIFGPDCYDRPHRWSGELISYKVAVCIEDPSVYGVHVVEGRITNSYDGRSTDHDALCLCAEQVDPKLAVKACGKGEVFNYDKGKTEWEVEPELELEEAVEVLTTVCTVQWL